MKLTNIILGTTLASLCRADDRVLRGWGQGEKGRGRGGFWAGDSDSEPLLERIKGVCDSGNYKCKGEDNPCSNDWERVDEYDTMFEGCRAEMTEEQKVEHEATVQKRRNMWMDMTKTERQNYKLKRQQVKAANAATILECACCDGDMGSVADLIKGREGAAARTLGFKTPQNEDGEGYGYGQGGGGGPHGGGHGEGVGQGSGGGGGTRGGGRPGGI